MEADAMIKDDKSHWRTGYDTIELFYKQYEMYVVSKSDKMGVIKVCNNNPEVIVPIEYDQIKVLFKDIHLLIAQKAEKYRLIKIKKSIQNYTQFYDEIGPFCDGFTKVAPVYLGRSVGIVNTEAEEIIPVQFKVFDNMPFYRFPNDATQLLGTLSRPRFC